MNTEIQELRGDMNTKIESLRGEIIGIRGDTSTKIEAARGEIIGIRGEMETSNATIIGKIDRLMDLNSHIKWVFGFSLAIISLVAITLANRQSIVELIKISG